LKTGLWKEARTPMNLMIGLVSCNICHLNKEGALVERRGLHFLTLLYRVIKEMLNHGADIDVTCVESSVEGYRSLTATELLQEVLMREYFEALGGILLREAQKAGPD